MIRCRGRPLEEFAMIRKPTESQSGLSTRAFLMSVMWIVALLAGYWVLADWQSLPSLITTTFAAM